MPLRDHFRPPLSEHLPWESFHAAWATCLAKSLNHGILPRGFVAHEHVHAGPAVEIDVATYGERRKGNGPGGPGTATLPRTVWVPATAPLHLPISFPPRYAVEIHQEGGGRTLVAALELVSPGNKDRKEKRRLFAAKCATYLSRGVGLVVVDIVTNRRKNLHNELVRLLGLDAAHEMSNAPQLYAVSYRPLRAQGEDQAAAWPVPLTVGEPLPSVALSLEAELCVRVDLEATYAETCEWKRISDRP